MLSRDLSLLEVEQSRVHVLYSISKDFGCSGMRLVRQGILPPSYGFWTNRRILGMSGQPGQQTIANVPSHIEQRKDLQRRHSHGHSDALRHRKA